MPRINIAFWPSMIFSAYVAAGFFTMAWRNMPPLSREIAVSGNMIAGGGVIRCDSRGLPFVSGVSVDSTYQAQYGIYEDTEGRQMVLADQVTIRCIQPIWDR